MKKILLSLVLLTGCATQGVDRNDQNQVIREFYASIDSIKQVELSSSVKTGMVGGAAIGFLDETDGDHQRMIGGALIGALVGGLFTALFEGSNKAFEYSLHSQSEGDFVIIQKEKIASSTACVKVRIASKASVSPALKNKCIP
jgi:outer membrane lipoprotein SlyB